MSGVGAAPALGVNPVSGSHVDQLLALADMVAFVQQPQYADRLRELQAAEKAASEAQATADAEQNHTKELLAHLRDLQNEFDLKSRSFDEYTARTVAQLSARENAVSARELSIGTRERMHAETRETSTTKLADWQKQLEDRDRNISKRESEAMALLRKLETQASDLDRRLAKIREAAQ